MKKILIIITLLLCMMIFKSAYAEEKSKAGEAYAVLTNEGELILFRSNNVLKTGSGQVVTDILGNSYTGHVYSGIEKTNAASANSKWRNKRTFIKTVRIADGQAIKPTSCTYWFSGCSNMTSCDLNGLDFSNVVDMSQMFENCNGLTNLDMSGWNTSNVVNMNKMFMNCGNLVSLVADEIDTSHVTNMSSMFSGCKKLKNLNVSKWNTSSVTNMGSMFMDCSSLPIIDVSDWITSNVTDMNRMFLRCKSLQNLDGVSNWDIHNVTDIQSFFEECTSIKNIDVTKWDTSNVIDMRWMFAGCKISSLDLSNFDVLKVTNMRKMFSNCTELKNIDLTGWDASSITRTDYMFEGCSGLTSIDLSNFDTTKATDMKCMFYGCSKLQEIELGADFTFKGDNIASTGSQAILPTPSSVTTTGKWIRDDEACGPYTPAELRSNYTSEMAGKWIWQEKPVNYIVKFLLPDNENYAGSMLDQKIKAGETGTLNENSFYRFNYHFDHWNGSDGKTYEDKAVIPANTFNAGDVLTLTAVFEKDDNHLSFTDGEAEITLHAGEKVVLPDLPGGMIYQVYEETPGGWQLVDQTNTAGIVPANGTADSSFVNEYVPGTATISLIAQKTLDGQVPADGQFTFELLQGDEVVQTVSNNAAGMVTFDQLVFKQPGTFIYKIREVRGEDASISYDSHVETITITVEDDGHGNLTATKSIGDTVPSFENETKPGTLQVSKETNDGTGNEMFTFEITLTDDYGRSLDDISILGGK